MKEMFKVIDPFDLFLGYEFIQHVIYERNKCKKLVTSNINPDKYRKNQTISVKLVIYFWHMFLNIFFILNI